MQGVPRSHFPKISTLKFGKVCIDFALGQDADGDCGQDQDSDTTGGLFQRSAAAVENKGHSGTDRGR